LTDKRKLIEVAIPLEAINAAAAAEGSVGQRPHPKNLHRWWARRPLSAARAVIWASLVDDPSSDPTLSPGEQERERQRLFEILKRLVIWENANNRDVLAEARAEIDRCYPDGAPPIVDPFGGGGAIPLEAQRLGLTVVTGDLNPVAVLIQKAMLEIPPRFADRPPVHPEAQEALGAWRGAFGLAADVDAYGKWMQSEARRRIGQYYPEMTDDQGNPVTPIAWIWARTVESPDPSWNGHVPLVSTWVLSKKPGKPVVWVEPLIDRDKQTITYAIRVGDQPRLKESVDRGGGYCIATNSALPFSYLREEGAAGRIGRQLIATVVDGPSGRTYLSPDHARSNHNEAADVSSDWLHALGGRLEGKAAGNVANYGLTTWRDLFTPRQLLALSTLSELLREVHEQCRSHALSLGWLDDEVRLHQGGAGALAYADAIVTYLAFAIDKLADWSSSICGWNNTNGQIRNVFAIQAIPMSWDFAEVNPFSGKVASWDSQLNGLVRALRDCLSSPGVKSATACQMDARANLNENRGAIVSTDPPYYNNISYADLSDFFYVWLRRNLSDIWPNECSTLATPKADELIASAYRTGSKQRAEQHFESGMAEFMAKVAEAQHPSAPATIYYAYKATETREGEIRSTGWDTFLQAVVDAGLVVTATWPMRTERRGRMIAVGANALASSIVLACRRRGISAPMATRAEFVAALRDELPEAVRILQSGNIAPVDIPQATMGPGIGVFSRFARVVESDGSSMRVSTALALINEVLGEVLDGEESEMDSDSRFALTWYSEFGYVSSSAGDADGMARAKNTSTAGVVAAGLGETRAGKFRLYERAEFDPAWTPSGDDRLTVWEATQHLIAALARSESEAAALLHQLGGFGERARTLAYLLFKKATDKGWASEAGAYNSLITAWPALRSAAVVNEPMGQQSIDYGSQENRHGDA
jgi:putative DNA methylase